MVRERMIYVDTCVFPVGGLAGIGEFIRKYPGRIGFEILPKLESPAFLPELRAAEESLAACPVCFHGPVLGAEHSAAPGTEAYAETMRQIREILPYARCLKSSHLVMHLNNRRFVPEEKEGMIRNACRNYGELSDLFGAFGCEVLVENTGTAVQGNCLLDQKEFTNLSREMGWKVLVDTGHAHANSWDIPGLAADLAGQIKAWHFHNNDGVHDQHRRIREGSLDFPAVLGEIARLTPEAAWIIEYVNPEQGGRKLMEDIDYLLAFSDALN